MSDAPTSVRLKGNATPFDETFEEATVKLPPEILEFLRREAGIRGVTTGDMLRIALGTAKFISEKVGPGAKLQIRNKDKVLDIDI